MDKPKIQNTNKDHNLSHSSNSNRMAILSNNEHIHPPDRPNKRTRTITKHNDQKIQAMRILNFKLMPKVKF